MFYEEQSAKVFFDVQEYNHRIPRLDNCVEEDYFVYLTSIVGDLVGNLFLKNCGYDTVGTYLAHLLANSISDPVEL